MLLNKWNIFRPLLCSSTEDYKWRVEAAKHIGDIYLRQEVAHIDIMLSISSMFKVCGPQYESRFYYWDEELEQDFLKEEMIHVVKEKNKISLVDAKSMQPLVVLIKDKSWR